MTPIEIASIMVKLKAGWTVIPQPVKSFFITRAKDTLMKGLGLDAISKAHETATERFWNCSSSNWKSAARFAAL